MIGADLVGAVIAGEWLNTDQGTGLARIRLGAGELAIPAPARGMAEGQLLRVQLLARDVIVATRAPTHLSVRNCVEGTVRLISPEQPGSDLLTIDIGRGDCVLARITCAATRELQLSVGSRVWALVKAVSARSFVCGAGGAAPNYK
jgi:molybdate transport system ATP-binding protein